MFRWLAGLGASDREVEQVLSKVTTRQWEQSLSALPFLMGLSAQEIERLKHKAAWFLASKRFSAAQEIELTDEIMLSIAVQACLPILNLDTELYEGWTQVIVYPGAFLIAHTEMDDAGVVHEYVSPASGEAWEGGPVILSWDDVQYDSQEHSNVVIHEFAHKLDLYNGQADGIPSKVRHPGSSDMSLRQWQICLSTALDRLRAQVEEIEQAIAGSSHAGPELAELAQAWYATLPMDPYAVTDEAEFFAVSSEVFFVDPARLERVFPKWYDCLRQYYQQDPLARLQG